MKVVHLGWGRLLVGVVIFVPLLDASAQTQAQAVPPGPEQLASKVEEYMAARVKRDHFSGSILIARDGKVLYSQGYIMLGQIIETASGKNYPSFMKEAIFGPLDMRDTGYDNATALIKHRASGYTRRLGVVLTNCDYIDMSIPHAAGALYSTVLDLLKWDQALYSEKLVPAKSLQAMFTPHKDNYGYGWIIDKKLGVPRYSHGGGIMGFVTTIERYPDEKLLVVALSNLENAPVWSVGSDLAAMAKGEKYTMPGAGDSKKVAGKAAPKAKAGSQP